MTAVQIEMVAETSAGERITLPTPALLTLESGYDTPADSLSATFWGEGCPNGGVFASVSLAVDGRRVFRGIVDEQHLCRDESGQSFLLYGRSDAAILLDNEAPPQTFYRLTLQDLHRTLVAPYGFGTLDADDPTRWLASYLIPKGTSIFEAVEQFCLQAGLPAPRIDGERNLVVRRTFGPVHRISNREKASDRYLSCDRAIRRDQILSQIRIRAEDGVYRSLYQNPYIGQDIRRERFFIPPTSWAQGGSIDAKERIRRSMLLSSDLTLRLPGWYEAELYDRVQCPDLGGTENWFVAEIRRQIERRGIFTTLVLRDRSYL